METTWLARVMGSSSHSPRSARRWCCGSWSASTCPWTRATESRSRSSAVSPSCTRSPCVRLSRCSGRRSPLPSSPPPAWRSSSARRPATPDALTAVSGLRWRPSCRWVRRSGRPRSVTVTVLIPSTTRRRRCRSPSPSLLEQSSAPDRVIVVADNCTDRTVDIAREHGVEVFEHRRQHPQEGGRPQPGAERAARRAWATTTSSWCMDADTVLDDGLPRRRRSSASRATAP